MRQEGQAALRRRPLGAQLDARHRLSLDEYDYLIRGNSQLRFGTRNVVVDARALPKPPTPPGAPPQLRLREIKDYHRIYEWQS